MANIVTNAAVTVAPEAAIERAVQYFTGEYYPGSRTPTSVTFTGQPPAPVTEIILTAIGFAICVIPGLIMLFTMVLPKMKNRVLSVTATAEGEGSRVTITHPVESAPAVNAFLSSLGAQPSAGGPVV